MKQLLIILSIFLISCSDKSDELIGTFQGVDIKVLKGDHDYYLKQIGNDSLFINIHTKDMSGIYTGCDYYYTDKDYIYFTKGHIKTLSWETGGKYSEQITITQK